VINALPLKAARVANGMTQATAAKELNMTLKTYNRKENGLVEFTASEVSELCKIFKLDLQDVGEIFLDNLPNG
jgi:DNA-binding XRE family transcriptional regulator